MTWKEHSVLKSNSEATRPEAGTVRLERMMPAPIERVWQYLVDPELRATWLGGGTATPTKGEEFDLDFDHARITDDPQPSSSGFEPHHEIGTVLECEPPRLLSYSWGEWFGPAAVVTMELEPAGDETRLTITHSRVTQAAIIPDVATGWTGHLDALEDKLRGGSGEGFWTNFDEAHERYQREWA
jgi:uncharacterized protein YndB with AHSA1/START domain